MNDEVVDYVPVSDVLSRVVLVVVLSVPYLHDDA